MATARARKSLITIGVLLGMAAPRCTINSVCYGDHDCASDQLCVIPLTEASGQCRLACEQDQTCPADEVCQALAGKESGICDSPCKKEQDCTAVTVCDTASGKCLPAECDVADDCPGGLVCNFEGSCMPDTPPECYPQNECEFAGQMLCVAEVPAKYRTCVYGQDRCLSWDCAT